MPALLWIGGSAAVGWLAGLFSSDALANLLRWVLLAAGAFALFYAYRAVKG